MNEEIYCFTDGINLFQPNIAFLKKTFAHKKIYIIDVLQGSLYAPDCLC